MKRQDSLLIHDPGQEEDFFIGWGKLPSRDRRFLLGAVPAIAALSAGKGWAVASQLQDPGAGSWQTDSTHEVTGELVRAPYPMIRGVDAQGRVMTTLLVAMGKCTSSLDIAMQAGGVHTATGVLIERRGRHMLEVPFDIGDWLKPAPSDFILPDLTPETVSDEITLQGMIMDTKCFFGVMRPGRGKTHKACASLCIRGGIPPSFWAKTKEGQEVVMLLTDEAGNPVSDEILPLVAEAVEARGRVVRYGDWPQFQVSSSNYRLL
ncbi:hypothetical protein [Parvularcula sp. IMCC14364]|uniref:hypothetical protein n=1 Tax=Parvularcula sp. IMCC14364 TaxID=3067902 RepID=UPI002740F190|nr:hypothetical protein [Parvularcula sp. IMCC14364]